MVWNSLGRGVAWESNTAPLAYHLPITIARALWQRFSRQIERSLAMQIANVTDLLNLTYGTSSIAMRAAKMLSGPVVEIVPGVVVEIVPALVVEIVPAIVVEIVPAKTDEDIATANNEAQRMDLNFFMFLLLAIRTFVGVVVRKVDLREPSSSSDHLSKLPFRQFPFQTLCH